MVLFDFRSSGETQPLIRTAMGVNRRWMLKPCNIYSPRAVTTRTVPISDANVPKKYYDSFGEKEWMRLSRDCPGELLYHVHMDVLRCYVNGEASVLELGWGILPSVLAGMTYAFSAKRFRSTWFPIILHSGQVVFMLFLILGLVLGLA